MNPSDSIDTPRDDAGRDETMYATYVVGKLRRAEQEIRDGKGVTHEQAKKSLLKWLK
jgi:hypothetical protein